MEPKQRRKPVNLSSENKTSGNYTIEELYDEAGKLERLQAEFIELYRKWGIGKWADFIVVEGTDLAKPKK